MTELIAGGIPTAVGLVGYRIKRPVHWDCVMTELAATLILTEGVVEGFLINPRVHPVLETTA